MADMNNVNLIGNLVRDFELSYTAGGCAIGKGSIAVNRNVKKATGSVKETSYFDFTTFGKLGENLKQYLTKGTKIAIHGWLKQERWQDPNTQQNRTKVSINVTEIQLLGNSHRDGAPAEDAPVNDDEINF